MQGSHGRITVTKVKRGRLAFLLHPWIDEPGLFEHVHFLDRVHRHIPCFPVKLELLSSYPHRHIGGDMLKEQATDFLFREEESPSRLVPQTPVFAHVELNIEVHTFEWYVAFDELDIFVLHCVDKGVAMNDRADSPDDLPPVRLLWDVAYLDFHWVVVERVRVREVQSVADDLEPMAASCLVFDTVDHRDRSHGPTSTKPMTTTSPSLQQTTPSSRNPVALRFYKILGTNFDDEGTRQALKTVSELYGPSLASLPISQKPVKPNTDSDSDEEQVSNATQTTFSNTFLGSANVPGDTAVRARKHLRRDVENKLTDASHKFLKAFGEVDQVRCC